MAEYIFDTELLATTASIPVVAPDATTEGVGVSATLQAGIYYGIAYNTLEVADLDSATSTVTVSGNDFEIDDAYDGFEFSLLGENGQHLVFTHDFEDSTPTPAHAIGKVSFPTQRRKVLLGYI